MQKNLSAGILYIVTACLTGYMALYVMLQTINGAPSSWLHPIMLGASILLLVSGVHVIASRVKKGWLVTIAGFLPIIMCGVFGGLPPRCWLFAISTALVTWASLALASAFKKRAIMGLVAALILAALWALPYVRTLSDYFSPKPRDPNPVTLLWILVPWIPIVTSIVAGIMLSVSPGPAAEDGKSTT